MTPYALFCYLKICPGVSWTVSIKIYTDTRECMNENHIRQINPEKQKILQVLRNQAVAHQTETW